LSCTKSICHHHSTAGALFESFDYYYFCNDECLEHLSHSVCIAICKVIIITFHPSNPAQYHLPVLVVILSSNGWKTAAGIHLILMVHPNDSPSNQMTANDNQLPLPAARLILVYSPLERPVLIRPEGHCDNPPEGNAA
jgi:hypothetical protein